MKVHYASLLTAHDKQLVILRKYNKLYYTYNYLSNKIPFKILKNRSKVKKHKCDTKN